MVKLLEVLWSPMWGKGSAAFKVEILPHNNQSDYSVRLEMLAHNKKNELRISVMEIQMPSWCLGTRFLERITNATILLTVAVVVVKNKKNG